MAYVDELILIGNNMEGIKALNFEFKMKDMGELWYFLGIEDERSEQDIFLSQKKCIADILSAYGLSNCRPLKLHMDAHVKLLSTFGDPLT